MAAKATGAKKRRTDTTVSVRRVPERKVAEHERQFLEILEHCPAALIVVDDDGRLLFHNARLRELLGYAKDELDLIDTRRFWHDLSNAIGSSRAYASGAASCSTKK